MCDFQPGDEVVCVNVSQISTRAPFMGTIKLGEKYIVLRVGPSPAAAWHPDVPVAVWVSGAENRDPNWPELGDMGFRPSRFRKVQKRLDSLKIESFMTMPGGYEEPRRKAPEKARTGIKAD